MKKFTAFLLSMFLTFSPLRASLAREETAGPLSGAWNIFAGWAQNAWEDASQWSSEAWEDASEWASGAWEDASEWMDDAWEDASALAAAAWESTSVWVLKAWEDTASWASEIWGDTSAWAKGAWNDTSVYLKKWWSETFDTIKDPQSAWVWLVNADLANGGGLTLQVLRTMILRSDGPDAEEDLWPVYEEALGKIGILTDDARKVWDTLTTYAETKGISTTSVLKIALPFLIKLAVEEYMMFDSDSLAAPIALYLIAGLEKLHVQSDSDADELIGSLQEALGGR